MTLKIIIKALTKKGSKAIKKMVLFIYQKKIRKGMLNVRF